MPKRHPQQIVLVRHGETEWSLSGRHTGKTDIDLTARGVLQAQGLGDILRNWEIEAVFTSPMLRARRTCELAGFSGSARVLEGLGEWDYGDFEGKTTAEIRKADPQWFLWQDGAPGGEGSDEVTLRVDSVISEAKSVSGDCLIFAHGHVLRALCARWIGLETSYGRLFNLSPATVSVLGYEREQPVISMWNCAALEK